jgi:hypothetical protein
MRVLKAKYFTGAGGTLITTIPYGKNVLSSSDNTAIWTWFSFAAFDTRLSVASKSDVRESIVRHS